MFNYWSSRYANAGEEPWALYRYPSPRLRAFAMMYQDTSAKTYVCSMSVLYVIVIFPISQRS